MRDILVAWLIPLCVFLVVLSSDISGQRQELDKQKKESEDDVTLVRRLNSSMKFTGSNLEKSCDVCQEWYGIDKDDCLKAKKLARFNCFMKTKDVQSNFKSKWQVSEPQNVPPAPAVETAPVPKPALKERPKRSAGESGPIQLDTYFTTRDNTKKACKICKELFHSDYNECKNDQKMSRRLCKMFIQFNHNKFQAAWEGTAGSPNEDKVSDVRKRESSMKFTDHFSASHLEKSCEVCHKLYGINKDDCTMAKKDAKLNCYKKAKDDRSNFMSKWQESSSKSVPSGTAAEHAPADKHPPSDKRPPSDKHPPAAESAPADKHHPADKHPPAAESAPANKPPPAAESAPANKPPPAAESAPAAQSDQFQDSNNYEYNLIQSLGLDQYFTPEKADKPCRICNVSHGIDYEGCLSGLTGARFMCKTLMSNNVDRFFAEWDGGTGDSSHHSSRKSGSTDYFNPENLAKSCKICHDIAQVDEKECKADDGIERLSCRTAVEQRKTRFETAWARSGGSS